MSINPNIFKPKDKAEEMLYNELVKFNERLQVSSLTEEECECYLIAHYEWAMSYMDRVHPNLKNYPRLNIRII